jgi:peptidyl-prolyl cis-trans isomerase B (cyclophilin B)
MLAAVVAVVLVVAAVAYLGLRDDDKDAAPGSLRASATPSASAPADPAQPTGAPATQAPPTGAPASTTKVGSCSFVAEGEPSRPVTPPTEADLRTGTVTATLTTSVGTVTLKLDGAKAPCAVASFVSLARQGFYDKTTCHRVLDGGAAGGGSIAQCGDPTATGAGGPGYTYAEENLDGATYPRGTVAMAKTAAPSSTGSQFFLVTQDFPLDPSYTVLGTITGGIDGIDKAVKGGVKPGTEIGAGGGQPNTPLDITKVTTSG